MTLKNNSTKVENLIKFGSLYSPSNKPIISDKHLDDAIALITTCAKEDPGILLSELFQNSSSYMACFGLAVLSAAGPIKFLSDNNVRHAAIDILLSKNPIQLIEFVEYLKSKVFGRGFGSRPQKWVRKIMEGWLAKELRKYIKSCPDEMYDLLRLVHPRYKDQRGEMIRIFIGKIS